MTTTRAEVRKKIKIANNILKSLRKEGYGDLSVISLAQTQQVKLTKVSSKRGNFIIGKTKNSDLAKLDAALDTFINSKWVTPEGRAEIREKAAFTLSQNAGDIKHRDVNGEQALIAVDVFSSDIAGMLRDKYGLPSDIVLNAVTMSDNPVTIERMFRSMYADFGRSGKMGAVDMAQYMLDWFKQNDTTH